MTSFMETEIFSQPDLLEQKAEAWEESAKAIRPLIQSRKNIIVLGRGTSGNAGIFASYLFGLTTGRHPVDFRPWLATQETPEVDHSDTVVLTYSQSGESTDIIQAAAWLKKRGAKIVGITNAQKKDCSLAGVADQVFYLNVGPELAIPATKTFSAQLFATAALAGMKIVPMASQTAACMREYLNSGSAELLAGELLKKSGIIWLSRGLNQPAALDSSLKIQETVNLPSAGWSTAEFLHGPAGSLQASEAVIIFGETEDKIGNEIKKILEERKVQYFLFAEKVTTTKGIPLSLPSEAWAKTVVYTLVGQTLALKMAEKKGLNPDKPLGLKKVTKT